MSLLLLYGASSNPPLPVLDGLRLYLDSFDSATITKTYQNIVETGSGTIGTTTITASATVASKVQAGMKLRIGGTDIYTVSTVVTTTITTVETLSATYTAGSALALDRISQWNDKSGYDNHATQATVLKQPIYNPARLNGKAVATWDGATGFSLPSGLFSIPNGNNTIFIVARNIGTIAIFLISMTESGASRQAIVQPNATQINYVNTTTGAGLISLTGVTNSNPQIIMTQLSGTTQKVAVNNGAAVSNSNGSYENGINAAGLGASSTITTAFLTGDIAMVLIYNRALTDAEIISVNRWISARTAIIIA